MTNVESFVIMDGPGITFSKQTTIPISRSLAAFLTLLIVGCIAATGLIVYFATSCSDPGEMRGDRFVCDSSCDFSAHAQTNSDVVTAPGEAQTEANTERDAATSIGPWGTPEETKTEPDASLRLPASVVPASYELYLVPFVQEGNFTFHGNVSIVVNVTETTDNVTLHSDSLEIETVRVYAGDEDVELSGVSNDTSKNFLIISTVDGLEAGRQYRIDVVFKGVLNDLLLGFYRSSYTSENATRSKFRKAAQPTSSRRPARRRPRRTPSATTPPASAPGALQKRRRLNRLRLPASVVPASYDLYLVPFVQKGNCTFHGNVSIVVNVTEATDNVTLHSDSLEIETVRVYAGDEDVELSGVSNDTSKNFLIISTVDTLEAGRQYRIDVVFKGALNDLLLGFYRSSYKSENATRWIAVTQFQTTDARRAFPCFDEPSLKATFQINIARLKDMTTLSNMPKIGNSEDVDGLEGYVWDHYEESVPMSTYLLAFSVSDFESITSGEFSVWARKEAITQSAYSLQIGPKLLSFYEDFFGIDYPLPKMDMIALPDFSAGAMENWGLITFRESLLLYQEGVSSKDSLQKIAQVVAHELAHQWFGNLVTPVWWSDLWLNEGFATFAEYLGANAVDPSWKMLDQFIIGEVQTSMFLDALKSSHQISVKVNDPDEISHIFDRISYSKSAAIIRMMQHFLTDDVFRRGLTKYLLGRMYSNAEQDDLWHTLTVQSHEYGVLDQSITVKQIMDTWTLQTGFPVVTVIRNYQDNSVVFKQERFTLDDSNVENDTQLWWIPLTFGFGNGSLHQTWMKQEAEVVIEDIAVSTDDWILVNVNFTGYYRVNYDDRNWKLITDQLTNNHLMFDPKNRAQILDDSFSLASAGYLDYEVVLNITKYLVQEREFVPWQASVTHLDYIQNMFERTAHFDKFKAYLLQLMKGFYDELGFVESPTDSLIRTYSRVEILDRVCRLGYRDCILKAVHEFQNWINSVDPDRYNSISPNLRRIVYCTAIRVGGQEEWDFLWKRYLNTNVGSEKEILMDTLACSKEIWILSRYLDWAITPNSGIRKQDIARVFVSVADNAVGKDLAYKFMKIHWDRIRSYLGPSSMSLSGIVRATAVFNTREEVDDFKNFANHKHDQLGVAFKTAQQTIEQGEANVKWMSQNFEDVLKWLMNASF